MKQIGRSVYRVLFSLDGKSYELLARTVNFEQPYFVRLEELCFEDQSKLVVSPYGDQARKRFGEAYRLLVPLQSIQLIEEIPDGEKIKHLSVAKG